MKKVIKYKYPLYTLKNNNWERGGVLTKESRTITLYHLVNGVMTAFGTGIY